MHWGWKNTSILRGQLSFGYSLNFSLVVTVRIYCVRGRTRRARSLHLKRSSRPQFHRVPPRNAPTGGDSYNRGCKFRSAGRA